MSAPPRLSRLWWVTGPLLLVSIGAVILVGALPVPYVALSPGGARSVQPLIEVSPLPDGPAVEVEPPDDDLLYVTVSSRVEPNGFFILRGWIDDQIQVEPSAPFLGTQTSEENRSLNLALMTDSQDKARKVALERLGFDVETVPIGAFLEDVDPAFPASSVLRPGMTVVGAGGEPVTSRDDLVEQITSRSPGDVLDMAVIPLGAGESVQVAAELGTRPEEPGGAVLGVTPVDRVDYEFPVDITFSTGSVGGPSAGLAFTLAILDRMTPGSLLGDQRVAVTGTMELDGRVGEVGGVVHKTEAAVREGAKVFLVPPQEFEAAVEVAAGRIEIVSVATLDDALEALEAVGGAGLPGED